MTDAAAVRRDLHAHPELGFTEIRTAARVDTALRSLGWTVRSGSEVFDATGLPGLPEASVLEHSAGRALAEGVPEELVARFSGGHTAVVADLHGNRPGRKVALRFDMDALPITETSADDHRPHRQGFASGHPGVMHTCGHDGHVAIGLALAAALSTRDFPGSVRLLFQPAEEGVRGAQPMVAAGACADVDVLLAIHLAFGLPSGLLAPAATELIATSKYLVRFTGREAHAAKAPEQGRNALLAAATATLNLHALPRFAGAVTRVNVGRLQAGVAANVIAGAAELAYETRADTAEVAGELARRAELVVRAAAEMHEVEVELIRTGYATAATTDPAVAAALTSAAGGLAEVYATHPLGASDDASLLMRAVQESGGVAGYAIVGSDSPGPPHSPRFDVDEEVLPVAVSWLERAVQGGQW
ncbi:amidohydrolase [Streptosporangium sp. NBC_01756]|uniref:amidohydrolase n=1 Tax=Streptosporangium sp. NBC_01756 TaxID=2975950 RepID=UPI002DD7FC15|nr:amidohydrolase [Streptosporangium sp. NBC_01756]WSC89314.1 amidohydrolase [Streptosporangium sp. NBC_01756]